MLMFVREYARQRGVSHTAVLKAVKAGKIPLVNGKIDPDVADAAWARNRDARKPSKIAGQAVSAQAPIRMPRQGGAPAPGTYAHAQLSHETARAKKAMLEALALEGQLLKRSEVAAAWTGMMGAAKSRLLTIGDELCDKLAAETDPVHCRSMVDEVIYEALAHLAEYPAEHPANA